MAIKDKNLPNKETSKPIENRKVKKSPCYSDSLSHFEKAAIKKPKTLASLAGDRNPPKK